MKLKREIKTLAKKHFKKCIKIRREIHANPELSFFEQETSKYIQSMLTKENIPFKSNIAKNGIVALIKGKKDNKKVIALRADFDALPIQEENQIKYKSKNKGIMHACGHDVHTACLLGAGIILKQLRKKFSGSIKLIFQPAEEKIPGGAQQMIKEGVLQKPKVETMLAQHVFPDLSIGKVGFKHGLYMASADEIFIKVKGKGGHAAIPDKVINPIFIASHIIISLNSLIDKNNKKKIPTVLAFGKIIGNGYNNIIPNEVTLEGTLRTMDEKWRIETHKKIEKLAKKLAKKMGGECEVSIKKGYPCLINDKSTTLSSKKSAIEFLGHKNVVDLDLRMTAEDFSYYTQLVPSCFYRLGTSNSKKETQYGLHNSRFNVDEKSIEIGMGLMAYIAINELQ